MTQLKSEPNFTALSAASLRGAKPLTSFRKAWKLASVSHSDADLEPFLGGGSGGGGGGGGGFGGGDGSGFGGGSGCSGGGGGGGGLKQYDIET